MSFPQRILSLWLPLLATDRIFRRRLGRSWRSSRLQDASALVVSRREKNSQRIACLDAQASRLGLKPGMGIADARAMHPGVEIVESDPEADRRLLEALADWCDRYTPLVALDGTDGLLMDITGCAHLFGGEDALVGDLVSRLLQQGFEARAAIASTPGAAWAAARFTAGRVVPAGAERDLLAPLPLAALRIAPEIAAALEGVGLDTVESVLRTARAPVARRFGKELVLRLDQALGRVEEAISPRLPVPLLSVERHLAEPIGRTEDVERMILMLAATLTSDLERREEGATFLQLMLFRVDGAVSRLEVGASRPLRAPAAIGRLFHERLAGLENGLDAGFGFELVRLSAMALAPLAPSQCDLVDARPDPDADATLFADRLRARLGKDALLRPVAVESHIPERAVELHPVAGADIAAARPPVDGPGRERPLRLFSTPDPIEVTRPAAADARFAFRWRQVLYDAVRAEGPERIAPEWWRDDPDAATRDYFRVEDREGRRYWLFVEMRTGVAPRGPLRPHRWFMHGLFA